MTQDAREKNRENFPTAAALMDELREEFDAGLKLTYAKENGRSVGMIWEERMAQMPKKWPGL